MNTPVTSTLTPNITVRHLRINPQAWEWFPAMRFDVSGCQIKQPLGKHRQYARKLVKPMDSDHTVFGPIATSLAVADCAKKCHFHSTCMSFTHQTSDATPQCTGYSAWIVEYGTLTPSTDVFFRQDMVDIYGYKMDQEAAILYNIVEVRQDQGSAAKACTSMYTRLMVVDTLTKMEGLNRIITEYFVLKQDFRFFVAGTFTSSVWSYMGNTGKVIDNDLWSVGNPKQGQGLCVMLTETGLASVDCQKQLFAICGN
ncbi:uncharacterized protein [Argopecten irradians]|uniref:uncharacterized protein n=1 Tax=Argopecten irradians TaxID=31199 RepID=UPI00371C95B6